MVLRRVLWAIPVSDLGGVARHAIDVARHGLPGWRLVFLVPPGPLAGRLRAYGAAVLEEPFGPDAGLPASVSTLRRAIRHLRPDVVHTHLSYADIVAALAVPRVGPRLISTEHGIAADDLVYHGSSRRAKVMAEVHRQRMRRFDGLIAVSEATASAMRDKWRPAMPIHVILNGVDPVPFAQPATGLQVLSLARLAPEKRLDRLVDAFAVVHRQHPHARLVLAGHGECEQSLRDQVSRLGLGDVVTLPGYLDADTAMRDANVIAQLSVWENCSYTVLDAAAHGLGVVAAGVGGNAEILPARCLVDPEDNAAVARAVISQGTIATLRPDLIGWPTLAEMCDAIAGHYDRMMT